MNTEIAIEETQNAKDIAKLVRALLTELEPSAKEKFENTDFENIAQNLIDSSKIWVFIAKYKNENVGLITLHECAAIYAGGLFGEISELYVKPALRSKKVGELLLDAAFEKGQILGWKRIEVGSPSPSESRRTIEFYERNGFKCTGSRLKRAL